MYFGVFRQTELVKIISRPTHKGFMCQPAYLFLYLMLLWQHHLSVPKDF